MEGTAMIKIHRDNRVIFWLLIGGLVLNILWSLRLELQAKTTRTKVEQYHLNLNKNIDELEGLERFQRKADYIDISSNERQASIGYDDYGKKWDINAYDSIIALGKFGGPHGKMKISTGPSGKNSYMDLSSDKITLGLNDGSNRPVEFTIDRDNQWISLQHHDSELKIGNPNLEGLDDMTGLAMGIRGLATLAMTKKKGTAISDNIGIQLRVSDPNKKDFHLHMKRDEGLIELRHHDSIFRVGKTPQGEGIAMGDKEGSLIIRKGKGVGLVSTKQIRLEATGEHSKLTIEADGDINIRSKNGVVRINGKKIKMNK